ncbi:LacI family transcriptional regulator [Leucobacter allii]|uniref:LacI family transcriptional regulator n=1 Tax=Leucobacter allii TaxID=2932247 RepID=A0ABY4FKB4_9MICO|nr:LacI family DNA-binding transcriptional regulator [Leucobacter allii]UOQ56802.1 LacI family transcriptional regulator [Leucobacter allii]UOR01268.1 LacI family transcriptional regulator [Leucobacter allii]
MATIRDVARLAGVSSGTVSNVLNRPSYVRTDTRERVLQAIAELDFVPDQRSRQFRPGRARTIGIAVAELGNPFFVDVALGAEAVCREQDLGVVLCNSSYDPQLESQNLDLLVQQRVQGIIISPVDEKSSRLDMLKDRGVPMVFVDRVGDDRDVWSVVIDDREGGRLGARHLIAGGHRRIAFLGHPHRSPKVRLRYAGAREVVNRSDGDITLELVSAASWTVDDGRRLGAALAARPRDKRPTAVLCANDMLALGLVQELLGAGLRVPEDIAVVGYDDIAWAELGAVPLTTIAQPRELLGRTAVEMMMHLIDPAGPLPEANHIVLAPELVVRASA